VDLLPQKKYLSAAPSGASNVVGAQAKAEKTKQYVRLCHYVVGKKALFWGVSSFGLVEIWGFYIVLYGVTFQNNKFATPIQAGSPLEHEMVKRQVKVTHFVGSTHWPPLPLRK